VGGNHVVEALLKDADLLFLGLSLDLTAVKRANGTSISDFEDVERFELLAQLAELVLALKDFLFQLCADQPCHHE
jgi:hypothetical protein